MHLESVWLYNIYIIYRNQYILQVKERNIMITDT